MFCPEKNSFLQLECAMEPRLINKAVRRAMRKTQFDPRDEIPPARRLESMQPSLFAPSVDITRARLGYGFNGLRAINRELNSEDSIIKLQAIHSVLDQVQIPENAMFLINLNVVFRVIELLTDLDPIVREKSTLILIHLTNYYQGRNRIMSHPHIVDRIIEMFMRDRKEIRYIAALFLKTLTRRRCHCEIILKNDKIVENLLKVIIKEHMGISIFHLNSLKNLCEWDPVRAIKANAFQIMRKLMKFHEYRVVAAALDCLAQICKHDVGKQLADQQDLTYYLQTPLLSADIEVIISAVGVMTYTTVTTKSKWRAKEFSWGLCTRLVTLCVSHNLPALQIRAMQVLINLCDCPDIKHQLRHYWKDKIKSIKIRTHEQWDGTSETTTYGLETGHNYRTMCIEPVETIRNDYGDNPDAVTVHSFLKRARDVKARLLKLLSLK